MARCRNRLYDLAAVLPPLGRLRRQRDCFAARVLALEAELEAARGQARSRQEEPAPGPEPAGTRGAPRAAYDLYPPGHFHSAQPDLDEVAADAGHLFDRSGDVAGVNLGLPDQLALLEELRPLIAGWPYAQPPDPTERPDAAGEPADGQVRPPLRYRSLRYRPDNDFFGWTDSQLWYALLRRWRPRRVVEVGSGWSSGLLLDTVERHDLATRVTCIEPNPERLHSVMLPSDRDRVTLLAQRVQDTGPAVLADLRPGDVLFIDSSHVSKVGSDVNHLLFDVLPCLAPGIHVHVHDVAYPFEYPREWVLEGRAWNEAYLLRAFLIQNPRWRITLWPSLLYLRHADVLAAALHPATPVDGGSLWLESH